MRSTIILGVALAAIGCGSTTPDTSSSTSGGTTNPDMKTLEFTTPSFDIAPGDDFECFYTDVTVDHDLGVLSADAQQEAGGHHITVYYTDSPKPPSHHVCSDQEMLTWHMVAGAGSSNGGEPVITLPEGMATRVKAGSQIVVQAHYINTTGATRTVQDSVKVHYEDASKVKTFANQFAIFDGNFSVPAHGQVTSKSTCVAPSDLNVVLLGGHMHEFGKHFSLEQIDESGKATMLYDHDWQPSYASHPPTNKYTQDKPFVIKKGTKFRQTCEWDNTTANPLAFPREMCVTFSMYFPDNDMVVCNTTPEK